MLLWLDRMFYLHRIAPLLEACKPRRCSAGRSLRCTQARGAQGSTPPGPRAGGCPRRRLPRWSTAFVSSPVDLLAWYRMLPGWREPDTSSPPHPARGAVPEPACLQAAHVCPLCSSNRKLSLCPLVELEQYNASFKDKGTRVVQKF